MQTLTAVWICRASPAWRAGRVTQLSIWRDTKGWSTSQLRLSRGSAGSRTGGSTPPVTTSGWTVHHSLSQIHAALWNTLRTFTSFYYLFYLQIGRVLFPSCWGAADLQLHFPEEEFNFHTVTLWSALFELCWYLHKRREKQGRQYLNYRNLNYSKCNSSEATAQLCFASHKLTQILLQPEGEGDKMQGVKSSDGRQEKPPAPGWVNSEIPCAALVGSYIDVNIIYAYVHIKKNIGGIPVIDLSALFFQQGRCVPWTLPPLTNPSLWEDLDKGNAIFTPSFR